MTRPEDSWHLRLAARILARMVPEEDRSAVLGDFEELWHRTGGRPLLRRFFDYWIQALSVGIGLSWYRLRRGRDTRPPLHPPPRPRRPRNTKAFTLPMSLLQDARLAARGLWKRPLFTLSVVFTVALGIGGATSMFSAVDGVLFRPLPFAEPDRLLHVPLVVPAHGGRPELEVEWSYPKYRLLAESVGAFEASTTYRTAARVLTGEGYAEEVQVEIVGPGYFPLLGAGMAEGRAFSPEEDQIGEGPFVVILSHGLWSERYGADPGLVGRTVRLNDRSYTVVGIAPPGFLGLSGGARLWIPAMSLPVSVLENPDNHSHTVAARVRKGVSLDQARAELATFPGILDEAFPPDHPGLPPLGVRGRPLGDLRTDPAMERAVLFLLGAVGTVLLIVCTNIANTLLVRGRGRGKEIAMRMALGANRSRILQQLMVESFFLAGLGGVLGLGLAGAGTPILRAMGLRTQGIFPQMENGLTAVGFSQVALDGRALLFSVGVTTFVALAFGLAPALVASRLDLAPKLKGGGGGRPRSPIDLRSRTSLVSIQVALAFSLLTCGGLMLGSLQELLRSDVGIDPRGVLSARISLPSSRYEAGEARDFWVDLIHGIGSLPGIHAAGMGRCSPLSDRCTGSFVWFPDRPAPSDGIRPMVGLHMVGGDYFGALGIPLRAGRLVGTEDREDTPRVVMVGESTAEAFWPGEDPIDQRITIAQGDLGEATVVGVVGDVSYTTIEEGAQLAVYAPLTQVTTRSGYLLVRGEGPSPDILPMVRSLVEEMDPGLPLADVKMMHRRVLDAAAPTRFATSLLGLFAATGLALSMMGIFGVLGLLVRERTHELGVRRVLGASRNDIVRIVLSHSGWMIGPGLIIGAVLSWASTRILEGLLFEVRPLDPRTLLSVAALLVLSGTLASLAPALRALKVDPLLAVREE